MEYVFPDAENDEVIRALEHDEDSDMEEDDDMDVDEGIRVSSEECK